MVWPVFILSKAILPHSGTSDLFAAPVRVSGYTTPKGTYVGPHQAIRHKRVKAPLHPNQSDLFAAGAAKPATTRSVPLPPAQTVAADASAKPVPERVLEYVRQAIASMNQVAQGVAQGRTADEKFHGSGRYEADAYSNLHSQLAAALSTLQKFRAAAAKNGVDAAAVIDQAGGLPDLQPTEAARKWLEKGRAAITRAVAEKKAPASPAAEPSDAPKAPQAERARSYQLGMLSDADIDLLKREVDALVPGTRVLRGVGTKGRLVRIFPAAVKRADGSKEGGHFTREQAVAMTQLLAKMGLGNHLTAMYRDPSDGWTNNYGFTGVGRLGTNLQPMPAAAIPLSAPIAIPEKAGPQDGDRKTKDGVSYVLRDGRWHQDEPTAPPNAAPEPVAEIAPAAAAAPAIVEHVTQRGKTLQGVIRTDLSKDQAREIDPYTFRKDGGWFIRVKHLDAAGSPTPAPAPGPASSEALPPPDTARQAGKDIAAAAAAENARRTAQAAKLREGAEALGSKAQEDMNRDRRSHTHRMARMAAGAVEDAAIRLRTAETMHALADAIERGETRALSGVSSRAAVETLDSALRQGMYNADRAANLSYSEQEKRKGRPPEPADILAARMPRVGVNQSNAKDVAELIEARAKRGNTQAIAIMRRIAAGGEYGYLKPGESDIVKPAIAAALKNAGSGREWRTYSAKGVAESIREVDRLRKLGIETDLDLQRALAEFVIHRGGTKSEDPLKRMERELVGHKGNDFFPTPTPLVDQMIAEANIEPGMRVLEPSAGKGDIADAMRAAGATVDTVEMDSRLRPLLEAKGHTLVGHDFETFEAPEGGYDRIVMNPPFGGGADARHVMRAYQMLKPGGRLVAITGEGVHFRQDKEAAAFRDWLEARGGIAEKLPEGSFKSAFRPTGVATRLVVVDKPADADPVGGLPVAPPAAEPAAVAPAAEPVPLESGPIARADDYDMARAEEAYAWISHAPRRRAEQARQDYQDAVNSLQEGLSKEAVTPEQQRILRSEIEAFAQEYLKREGSVLAATSRTMSPMMAGPSNFPTGRNAKALDAEERRSKEFSDWQTQAAKEIRAKLRGVRTPEQAEEDEFRIHRDQITRHMATAHLIDTGHDSARGMDRSAFVNAASRRIKSLAESGRHQLARRLLDHIREQQDTAMTKPFFTARHGAWKLGEEKPLAKSLGATDGTKSISEAGRQAAEAAGGPFTIAELAALMPAFTAEEIADLVAALSDMFAIMPSGRHFLPMDTYLQEGDPAGTMGAVRQAIDGQDTPEFMKGRLRDQARQLTEAALTRGKPAKSGNGKLLTEADVLQRAGAAS